MDAEHVASGKFSVGGVFAYGTALVPGAVHLSRAMGAFRAEKAVICVFDNCIALAGACFQQGAIEHGNMTTAVVDHSRLVKLANDLCNAYPAHTQHLGNHFLRNRQLVRGQSVQA